MFLGFLGVAAIKFCCGTGPTIQIFDDDISAFVRLIDLMMSVASTIFRYLRDGRFDGANGQHAERNRYAGECNSDTAQTLLLALTGLVPAPSQRAPPHRSTLAIVPGVPGPHWKGSGVPGPQGARKLGIEPR